MDILLGKYEIQSYSYINENMETNENFRPWTVQSQLLGGGLTFLFYIVFWTLASFLKY